MIKFLAVRQVFPGQGYVISPLWLTQLGLVCHSWNDMNGGMRPVDSGASRVGMSGPGGLPGMAAGRGRSPFLP